MPSEFKIYFSYSQFLVSDETVELRGLAWTETHSRQGFARRPSTVSIGTILEFGTGFVSVYFGPYIGHELYERVISVPFFSPTSRVVVEGPEEYPVPVDRILTLQPGYYRLFAAQQVLDDDEELIDLYFQQLDKPANSSEILVAGDDLDPPESLLEEAEIAEV